MKTTVRLAAVGAGAAVATTLMAGTSLAATQQQADRADAGVVFVQTDAVGGNAIAVYDRSGDGVMLFYRGSWCPYCNAQLRAFQRPAPR
jgi:uncharacterized protein with PIN domain